MRNMNILILLIIISQGCSDVKPDKSIPVIYSTDLYNPAMDPDDNFVEIIDKKDLLLPGRDTAELEKFIKASKIKPKYF